MDGVIQKVGQLVIPHEMVARARAQCRALRDPHPAFTLFFSASDGLSRAIVANASASSFDEAWQEAHARLQRALEARRCSPRWFRIDWIERSVPTYWRNLQALLALTKRNYYRFGLSLDREMKHAFLEQELNANAMLYGGNTIHHAIVNRNNFAIYARKRFPGLKQVDFDEARAVFMLHTSGVFLDEKGDVHTLAGSGLDAGRRVIGTLAEADVTGLIERSSSYLERQVNDDGTFVYGYHPCFDRRIETYNTLRHASTTYSMIEAWEVTRDASLKDAIERSLLYLIEHLIARVKLADGAAAAFLVDTGDEVKLGGNAVALLALAKYAELTGTDRYGSLMDELATGICFMQDRKTGSFRHVLSFPSLATKSAFRTIYYEGEAAFALMRLYRLSGDERWLEAVELSFEHFIASSHWKHHDHWLAYCANELTRVRPLEKYFRFALDNVADYLDFVANRITTFPTLLELMMATRELITRLDAIPALRQLLSTLDLGEFLSALEKRAAYLLNGHFWPEMAMFFARPERISGSFFIRHHAFRVRIDDVEHYLSGFVAFRRYLAERDGFRKLVERHRAQRPAAQPAQISDPAEFWTTSDVEAATHGSWAVSPAEGWGATGLSTFAPAMQSGNIAVVRTGSDKVGMLNQVVRRMKPLPAAIMAITPSEIDVPGVPVLGVADAGAAVLDMGRYARAKMTGRVIGVTGSAGKTTTVAMMAHTLEAWGAVSKSAHNANLPHGVAWNLASIPWHTPYAVLELAIGRMALSSRMARPHVAIFTNVLPAHLGATATLADIAKTKSAIFLGMERGATAVIHRDMQEWEIVHSAARRQGLEIVHYGTGQDSDFQLLDYDAGERRVRARIRDREVDYQLGAAGTHMALNSLAILAAVAALGNPLEPAIERLAAFAALSGRGEELRLSINGRGIRVIDDSYNANPGSMKVALERLGNEAGERRRVAVLGEMAELGPNAASYHTGLVPVLERSPIDRVYVMGELYQDFWRQIPASRKGGFAASLDALKEMLHDELADGDIVLFKGSNSTNIHHLIGWMKERASVT